MGKHTKSILLLSSINKGYTLSNTKMKLGGITLPVSTGGWRQSVVRFSKTSGICFTTKHCAITILNKANGWIEMSIQYLFWYLWIRKRNTQQWKVLIFNNKLITNTRSCNRYIDFELKSKYIDAYGGYSVKIANYRNLT